MISPYGITFCAAFALAGGFVFWLLCRKGIPKEMIFYSCFLNLCAILIGSKLYTSLNSGFQISFFAAGFSSLGGVIGLLLGVHIFNKIYGKEEKLFWQAYGLVIPLLYGISKLGCHFAGCCKGIPYSGPFAKICVEGGEVITRFPIQLTESIIFLLIFLIGVVLFLFKNGIFAFQVILISCSVFKFSLEFFRQEHIGVFLSLNQIVCIFIFGAGLFWIGLQHRGIKC